ncbi:MULTISPECIES: hypothetical protein [unclassified Sporosarcina]|uniref:hypothetical protein n=1 Tax=unclassified Sporosarcina TaxID=2647733 RepID=UPI0030FA69D7
MDKNIRHLFHKETINTEIGLDFEASEAEAARVRENATGKEYREALKETYRKTENKRSR